MFNMYTNTQKLDITLLQFMDLKDVVMENNQLDFLLTEENGKMLLQLTSKLQEMDLFYLKNLLTKSTKILTQNTTKLPKNITTDMLNYTKKLLKNTTKQPPKKCTTKNKLKNTKEDTEETE